MGIIGKPGDDTWRIAASTAAPQKQKRPPMLRQGSKENDGGDQARPAKSWEQDAGDGQWIDDAGRQNGSETQPDRQSPFGFDAGRQRAARPKGVSGQATEMSHRITMESGCIPALSPKNWVAPGMTGQIDAA